MRRTASKFLDGVGQGGLLLAFWALGGVVFAQFFCRYFLNMPLGWTEELARYLLIATTFLGLPVVTRRGEHIAIEMLSESVPPAVRTMLLVLAEVFLIAIVAVLLWQAVKLSDLSSQMMSSLPLPKSVIYYVVLTGLGLQLLAGLDRLVDLVSGSAQEENRP